ncbi:MAG: hypothetical protein OXC95_00600 [Dehalococcoidia bacterium]|nr:hypothetical protein [Dehalococcoidia bacterium]
MDAVKAIFLTAVTLACAVGCGIWGDSGPPPELPETWLSEIIQAVPSDMGTDYLLFANYYEARLAADATGFGGFDTFIAEGPGSVPWTYGMLPTKGMFMSYSQSARNIIGLDPLGLDQGIWSPVEGTSRPPFSITAGGLEDQQKIYTRLGEADFKTTFHYGILLLYFWRDYPPALKEMMEHPMGTSLFNLNVIAPIEDRLAVSRKVETLERIIEVHDGKVSSLWDEIPWRVLTQSVGDELLGGALIPPEYVVSRTATGSGFGRSGEERLEDWGRYASGPDAWGTLEPYTALVAGYGVRYGAEGTTIAMYHPDPEGAERNADELKLRWKSARLDLRRFSGPDVPFSELCSPLETRTEVFDKSSVLTLFCPAIEQSNPTLIGTLGRDFWKGLVEHHELHFLVPDIGELTGRR